MRLKKYNSKKTSACGGNFVPHLSVAPLAAYAERGRVNPPSLHCVAPLSLPPPPLRGSPGFEAGCVCAWAHPQVCDCRCAAPAQTQGSREAAGAKRLAAPLPGNPLPVLPDGAKAPHAGRGAPTRRKMRRGCRPHWRGAPLHLTAQLTPLHLGGVAGVSDQRKRWPNTTQHEKEKQSWPKRRLFFRIQH